MSVSTRQVKNKRDGNGALTGKAGVVYDVNVKYQQQGKCTKLASPSYSPIDMAKGKQTVQEYMEPWVEQHGKANLRPSTFDGYKSYIRNHIVPHIGYVQLGHSPQLCWMRCFRRCSTRACPKALYAIRSAS